MNIRSLFVGGDTTKGKLSVTVQVMGEVEKEKLSKVWSKKKMILFMSVA